MEYWESKNNELYVFPSPTKESEDLGLKFVYDPTTVYDRGGGTNNIKEAENVVNTLNYNLKTISIDKVFKKMGFPNNWTDIANIERSRNSEEA